MSQPHPGSLLLEENVGSVSRKTARARPISIGQRNVATVIRGDSLVPEVARAVLDGGRSGDGPVCSHRDQTRIKRAAVQR